MEFCLEGLSKLITASVGVAVPQSRSYCLETLLLMSMVLGVTPPLCSWNVRLRIWCVSWWCAMMFHLFLCNMWLGCQRGCLPECVRGRAPLFRAQMQLPLFQRVSVFILSAEPKCAACPFG